MIAGQLHVSKRNLLGPSVMLGLALLLGASPVAAQAPRSEPRPPPEPSAECASTLGMTVEELAAAGKAHARKMEWVCARLFLGRAYARQASYDLAGNLGIVTHELALAEHDDALVAEAATLLSAALRGFPVVGPAAQRQHLAERLEDARGRVVTLSIQIEPEAACLTVAGRDAGCMPHPFPLFAAPGRIEVEAHAEGYRAGSEAIERAVAGSEHKLRLALEPSAGSSDLYGELPSSDPAPLAEERSSAFPLWPALVTGGVAVVGVAVGVGLWVAGDGEAADAAAIRDGLSDSACAPPIADPAVAAACDELADSLGRHDDYKNTAVGLFVVAGLLGAGAGVLAVVHALDGEEEASSPAAALEITPAVAPQGSGWMMGLSARGRW